MDATDARVNVAWSSWARNAPDAYVRSGALVVRDGRRTPAVIASPEGFVYFVRYRSRPVDTSFEFRRERLGGGAATEAAAEIANADPFESDDRPSIRDAVRRGAVWVIARSSARK